MMQVLERLRRAREEQGLDIDALAKRTRLRVHLLEAVEQGRWADLPRGVYARAVVRAYAEAVGEDPNRVITEVAPLLPEPEDPLDGMARVRGFERTPSPAAPEPSPAVSKDAEPAGMAAHARTAAAAAIDAAVLAALILPVIAATAALCGVPIATLVEVAAPAMVMLATLVAALYFLLLGGIGGATPGARLAGQPAAPRAFRGTATQAIRRAWALVLRESSIVGALLPWPDARRDARRLAAARAGTPWEERAAAR